LAESDGVAQGQIANVPLISYVARLQQVREIRRGRALFSIYRGNMNRASAFAAAARYTRDRTTLIAQSLFRGAEFLFRFATIVFADTRARRLSAAEAHTTQRNCGVHECGEARTGLAARESVLLKLDADRAKRFCIVPHRTARTVAEVSRNLRGCSVCMVSPRSCTKNAACACGLLT
jgi:hypothetical protein